MTNYLYNYKFNFIVGKHPVSLLNEFCAKRKWDIPKFDTLDESGPSHRKTFIMTVSNQNVPIQNNFTA